MDLDIPFFKKPRVWLAFLETESMWGLQEKSSKI